MGLQIKILGATPTSGRSLCMTCKHASVIMGQNCEERVICKAHELWLPDHTVKFKVASCGGFHPANMPWKYEMEDMAWIVEARKRGPTGFKNGDGEMEVVIRGPRREAPAEDPVA